MLTYDQYLDLPYQEKLPLAKRLKTIQVEIEAAARLSRWLDEQTENVVLLSTEEDIVAIIAEMMGEVVGFDIETTPCTNNGLG